MGSTHAIAVCIHGLRQPDSPDSNNPVVFCQGDLSGGLAASISAVVPGAILRHWISPMKGQVSGFGWQADPRNPIGEASAIKVRIKDVNRLLSPIFCEELGFVSSFLSWEIRENEIGRTQTTITVYGDETPGVDTIYWINEEAIVVENCITSGGGGVHELTIARGACGSRARRHRLKPRTYVAGAGVLQRQYMHNKPDFDRQKFPATVWQQTTEGNTGQSVVTWRRGYVISRPKPLGDAFEVMIEDATKIYKNAVIGNGRKEVQLSKSIHVFQAAKVGGAGGLSGLLGNLGSLNQAIQNSSAANVGTAAASVQPIGVEFTLTAEEAEKIFGAILRVETNAELDSTLTTEFIADVTPALGNITAPAGLRFLVEAGSWAGTFRLLSMERETFGYGPSGSPDAETGLAYFLRIRAELGEVYEGTLGEDAVLQQINNGVENTNPSPLAAGFATSAGEPVPPGAEGPKITLEWAFEPIDFPTAALYWFLSDQAKAGDLNGVYDVLPCWAVDFDPAAFDIGSAGVEPDIDPASSEFLKLAQLLPQKFTYPIRMGDRLGDWLENEARRAMVIWSSSPTAGTFGFRQMNRAYSTGATTFNAEVGSKEAIVYPGNRLPPLNQIRVELGYFGKDRAYQDYRLLTLQDGTIGALSSDEIYEQTIRYWVRSNFSAQSAEAASLPRLANFYFRTLRRAPAVYKVPASIAAGAYRAGDFVTYTNTTIQTASGAGIAAMICMVVGQDNDYATGRQFALLLPYALQLLNAVNGIKGPALQIIAIEPLGASSWRCYVRVIGAPYVQNLTTAYGSIYSTLQGGERLRLECPARHNPMPGSRERRGKLEASAILDAVGSNNSGLNWLDISIDAAWERAGEVDIEAELLTINKGRILLSDHRRLNSNPELAEIYPVAIGPEDYSYAVYAPGEPNEPLHRTYYMYQ